MEEKKLMSNELIISTDFADVVAEISQNVALNPDLMKSETGNNFRAVSESEIIKQINPILIKRKIFYVVEIKDSHLEIREAYGSKGRKLQFIATVTIRLRFWTVLTQQTLALTEAVGLGIDDCDKAMGKAYTYAVKYALLKIFRLRYADDPDFEASKPLLAEPPMETTSKANDKKSKIKDKEEKLMSESQRDYILGMMEDKGVSTETIMGKFKVDPKRDESISNKVARDIISYLKEVEDLPF